ncbi:ras-related protein RABA3-like [Hibiscus syriacus]|uniref:ras-related protein RABA3-like n=1 Tax=Hibiscus syriacus TaxID=106335 RepID=UPI001923DC18|nr:ras-related protein RABA3-like [Hibiscus syriacus]
MLLGNKADLVDQMAVLTEDAVEFAKEQRLFFAETSALTGDNVDKAFFELLEEIYAEISKNPLEFGNGKSNGHATALKGSKIDDIAGSDIETSEMKNLSTCSC